MEEQEVVNFLRSEGENLIETAIPIIDISENFLIDVCDAIESQGLQELIKNLGSITNAFKRGENDYKSSNEVREEAIKVIHTGLVRLHMEITASQGNVKSSLKNVDRQTKHKFRKYMAVLFFLIYKSFVEIERDVCSDDLNFRNAVSNVQKDSRRKKKADMYDGEDQQFRFWFHWRPKLIQEVVKLVSPPMEEILEGAPDGVNFMRCLTLALCTTIKNKTKHLRNMDDELEDMFDILGVLAARHQEEKGILSRLIPLLKESEETAGIIANGVHRMIEMGPADQAQGMALRALNETLDVYQTILQKESASERGFQAFLTQLCTLQPKGAMHSLATVVQFLETDSHIIRNAVLIVAHALLTWTWSIMNAEETSQQDDEEMRDERRRLKDNWLPLRKKLLDEVLLNHLRDVNSLVRSKATNLLTELVRAKNLLPAECVDIMKNVKNRLLDKTVTARKHAITLVIELVREYPHMVHSTEKFEKKLEEKTEEIVSFIRRDEDDPAVATWFIIQEFHLHASLDGFSVSNWVKDNITDVDKAFSEIDKFLAEGRLWRACEIMYHGIEQWKPVWDPLLAAIRGGLSENETFERLYLTYFKASYAEIFPEKLEAVEPDLLERNYIASRKVVLNRDFLVFLRCCYKMNAELTNSEPSLRKLLELGTTTDKKEAVMFYATICEKGYVPPRNVTISIINALSQLKEDELEGFVQPFKNIFIGRESLGAAAFVRKLLQVIDQLSETGVESISGMIGELYRSSSLTKDAIAVLWDAFSLATGGWNERDSRSAAYILGIIGQIERGVVTSNLNQLIETGLGIRGIEDYELAKVTLQTILFGFRVEKEFIEPEVPKGRSKATKIAHPKNKSTEAIKFPPTHELFNKIVSLIEYGLKEEGNVDSKMDIMYPGVVELSMQIIYRMCTEPSEIVMKFLPNIHGIVFGAADSVESESENPYKTSEKILFRYMSFGKAVLGAHINYYEQIVSKEIKQRKATASKSKKKEKTTNRVRGSRDMNSTTNSSMMNQSNQDAAAEMDLMIGNIGFDSEAEIIKTYISKLLDLGFFRQFRIHVLYLCQVFNTIKSLNLKVVCVQALAKLMLVCEASVVKSIEMFVRLWSSDEHFAVKLEILRASIRLTVRFPNQMEKINDCFSAGLTDKDVRVRKACLDYIQYLALSDLLKVREQLSDTAACLCDESDELREMARDFINEIAEKDNVLQNTIPDIISRLSGRDNISQEKFQNIMKTLLSKIKKDKQQGGLIDRIIGRFKAPASVRVCQDTAFCLTQLPQSDKTFKILKDNFSIYCDKLGDDDVWEYFTEILNALKKLNKPELKQKLEEWEADLAENHQKCVEILNAENAAKRKGEKQQITPEQSSSDEEEETDDVADVEEETGAEGSERNVNSKEDETLPDQQQSEEESDFKQTVNRSTRERRVTPAHTPKPSSSRVSSRSSTRRGAKPEPVSEDEDSNRKNGNDDKSSDEHGSDSPNEDMEVVSESE